MNKNTKVIATIGIAAAASAVLIGGIDRERPNLDKSATIEERAIYLSESPEAIRPPELARECFKAGGRLHPGEKFPGPKEEKVVFKSVKCVFADDQEIVFEKETREETFKQKPQDEKARN